MKYQKFEEFPIWRESISFAKEIYHITDKGKWKFDFGFRDQIRRAVVSVISNMVEGFEKNNTNEFIRFLKISKGSIGEVRNQLYLANEIEYISTKEFTHLNDKAEKLANNIGGFVSYLEKYRKNKS